MTKNQLLELFPIGPEIPSRFRLYDPVSAITGGVGLVGNVVGGFMGNSAAKKAGAIQQQAANNAADSVIKTAQDVNPQITTAAQNAGAGVSTSSGLAADAVQNAAKDAGTGVTTAAGDANSRLDSYSGAGSTAADQLKAGLAEGGDFNRNFTAADFQSDPGYQFRLQQGIAAMQRSGAAAGGALGGSAAKDLMSFNSGLAAQDYQNAFQRFQDQNASRYSRLFGTAGLGETAATTQGNNTLGAAKYAGDTGLSGTTTAGNFRVGGAQYAGDAGMHAADLTASNDINAAKTAADYRTGGAAAQAAGIVGGTNALTQGISGGINSATSALTLSQLMKNPALSSATAGAIGARAVGGTR